MELFGVGPLEALLVGVIAFILVGPDKFPELARQAGKWYRVARAFTADVMADVQGAVKEIEAEVDATTGGGLKSIRELTDSSTSILQEARADLETATASAQAAYESPEATTTVEASDPLPSEAIPLTEVAAEPAVDAEPVANPFASVPAGQPSNGMYGDPFEAAEVRRREEAAREAAARITGGGA